MDVFATEGDITIRRLRDHPEDWAAMARWRAEPHVREWWDPDEPVPTAAELAEDYAEEATPGGKATGCIIELDGRPVGYLQFYRWADFADEIPDMMIGEGPDTWGIDIHVGDPAAGGRGVGSRSVAMICAYLATERGASDVRLTTELGNVRAQRAYERAGFRKVRHALDSDTRDGERVWCWLMRWTPVTG